jgi:division protein CdvB (Snf7/Vps24/ESCRT-III family)
MKSMNSRVNLPAIQKIMMDFEKESEIMDMKEVCFYYMQVHLMMRYRK